MSLARIKTRYLLLPCCLMAGLPVPAASAEVFLPPVAVQAQPAPVVAAPSRKIATAEAGVIHPADQPNAPDSVELAALYFYAREGQMARLAAETRRLEAKYPGFTLPSDVLQPASAPLVDETPLWRMFEVDDFAGIEVELAQLQEQNPDWQPSADFRDKLARRKQRSAMTQAYEARDWMAVVEAGNRLDPKTEQEVDLLWMRIDAYSAIGAVADSVPIYQGILLRDDANRLADDAILTTLKKAAADFPAADIRAALKRFTFPAAMEPEVADLSAALLRREIADFTGATEARQPLAAATIRAVEQQAEAGSTADLDVLGWYDLKIGRPQDAETRFRRSMQLQANAENIKGLYLSLVQLKRPDDAQQLIGKNLEALADDNAFVLDALSQSFSQVEPGKIDATIVNAYSVAIMAQQSPAHAEMLGWYAYNSNQYAAAAAWFGKSFEWKKGADSLKGLLLANQQAGNSTKVAELKQSYAALYPQVFESLKTAVPPKPRAGSAVATPSVDSEATYVKDFRGKRFEACVAGIRAIEASHVLGADGQLIKGWCNLQINHLVEARAAFSAARVAGGATASDGAYGLALTLLRSNLVEDAEALLAQSPQTAARDRELRGEIFWRRASAAFAQKQYQRCLDALNARMQIAPEPADMSRMRGWAHYHLGHVSEATAVFTRLNMQVSDKANLKALAVIRESLEGSQ
jgi:tetratricopeptide (TPR) repeat protein